MNIKDYREKELKMYIISCIFLLICLTKSFEISIEWNENIKILANIIDTTLISSCIYIFTYIADSIFSSRLSFTLLLKIESAM